MMDAKAEAALAQLGVSVEEATELVKDSRAHKKEKKICICGHPMNRHKDYGIGQMVCEPTRMSCPCKMVVPVLDVADTRMFLYQTTGIGKNHALSKGMMKTAISGKTFTWIEEPACQKCGEVTDVIVPVSISEETGRALREPGSMNALLCQSCAEDLL